MNPRIVFVIAKNTFKELIRDRILYSLIVFAVLLFGMSIVLGELSFSERIRISTNLGFMGIHISAVILAIFVGSTLVAKEIEKQTILTLLARPISRIEFLLGKFCGLGVVITLVLVGLSILLMMVLGMVEQGWTYAGTIALAGILLEALVLLSLTMLFGVLSKPFLAVTFVIGFFLIGHWVDSMKFFVEKSESSFIKFFSSVIGYLVPNLEQFNWKNFVVYNQVLPFENFAHAVGIGAVWILLLLTLTGILLRRRDFV